MPFELRPYPTQTLRPDGDYLQTTWTKSVYPLAEKLGMHIVLPSVSPQPYTHFAFEGLQFAKAHGYASAYNHRIFTAFFQESLDIGNVSVLSQLAAEVGLDETSFRKALETRMYQVAHAEALRHVEEAGVQVVPTFVIGSRKLSGLYGPDGLSRVIDKEIEKQAYEF